MKQLRRLVTVVVMAGVVAGCARPVVVDNGVQRRVFVPCTSDYCWHDSYDIAWQRHDYPVSYRTRQVEYVAPLEYGYVGQRLTVWDAALRMP